MSLVARGPRHKFFVMVPNDRGIHLPHKGYTTRKEAEDMAATMDTAKVVSRSAMKLCYPKSLYYWDWWQDNKGDPNTDPDLHLNPLS